MSFPTDPPMTDRLVIWRAPITIVAACCLIAIIGYGVRSSFGLFLEPMTIARGWDRETFSLAMAIQNLLWGLSVPIASALADRFGPPRVLFTGAFVFAAGTWGMAVVESSLALHIVGGILTGIGVAFTAFSIVLATIAKVVPARFQSIALGFGTAATSLGQVVLTPIGAVMIEQYGWQPALLYFALALLAIAPLALLLPRETSTGDTPIEQTIVEALREALSNRGFVLLGIGFFVCGFHVAFIGVHFPAYVTDLGLAAEVGAYAIAIIGAFNIIGSFAAGFAGQRWRMSYSLATIYTLRAVCIAALIVAPKTNVTIYAFAAAMGLLWLSTVPLTTGIVAKVFGVRYLATLFGLVFLSHQLGSFIGVWLGGYLFDTYGSYDPVWWAGVVLGLLAAVIHLPIKEHSQQGVLGDAVNP